jgi:hypothetical protein
MPRYHCYAPGQLIPSEIVNAETSFAARRAYAAEHDLTASDVICRREDMIDDNWRKLVGPVGWDVVEA